MTSNATPSPLRPARSGARSNNPNAGRNRVGRMVNVRRTSDPAHRGAPCTVTFVNPATLRRRLRNGEPLRSPITVANAAGDRPVTRKRRAVWTADRLFDLASRAEQRGHQRRAEQLLALAIDAAETAQRVIAQ